MKRSWRLPSPALVVALIALFVGLSGTAVAAGIVPLAKRALIADNASKLQGKTAAQIAASVEVPDVKSVGALVTVKSQPYSLNPDQETDYTTTCDAGKKAIGGGVDEATGGAIVFDTRPSVDGQSWRMYLANVSTSNPSTGTLFAICIA